MATIENYAQVIEQKVKLMLDSAKSNEGWSQVKTKDGVEVSKKKTEDSSHLVRGQGLVNGSVEEILKRVYGLDYQKILDPSIISIKNIEVIDDTFKIVHQQNKMPTPLTNRDFVSIQHKRVISQDLAVTACTNIEHNSAPVDKNYVRGDVKVGGYVIEKVDDKQCTVTYVVQVDLKGMVPGFAVNAASVDQGLTILHLRKAMEA